MNEEAFYMEPVFWVAVAFFVFMALMLKFTPIVRIITRTLDTRSSEIARELSEARRLREDAKATLEVYQRKQRESLKEAEGILVKTQEDAKRMMEQAERDLKTALEKRMKLAVDKIAQAEAKALQDVQSHVVDIAIAAARTIIQDHLTRSGNEELIRQAAGELERKLH